LDTTYIKYDATFPPNIWVTQKVILKRTDDCESFRDKFGDLFTSVHPKISVFMKNVLAMQTDSYVQMNAANNNESEIYFKSILNLNQISSNNCNNDTID